MDRQVTHLRLISKHNCQSQTSLEYWQHCKHGVSAAWREWYLCLFLKEEPLHWSRDRSSPCAGHCHTMTMTTRSYKSRKRSNESEILMVRICTSAIFGEFMLIYAQIYAGKTGSWLFYLDLWASLIWRISGASSKIWVDSSGRKWRHMFVSK